MKKQKSTGLPDPVSAAQCSLDDAGALRIVSGHTRIAAFYDLCPDGVLVMGSPKGHVEVTRDFADGGLKGRHMQTSERFRVLQSDGSAFRYRPQGEADAGPEPERPRF